MDALKRVQLEILAQFSRVCEENGLTWYAMLGTLLGAVRHQGFIPWDDDIDVAMPRADYDRLLGNPALFDEPYFLQTPQNDPAAVPRFVRLVRDDTAYITAGIPYGPALGGHMGIHIDILPLDGVPDAEIAAELNEKILHAQAQMAASAALDMYDCVGLPEWKSLMCHEVEGAAGVYDALAARYERLCAGYPDAPMLALLPLGGGRGRVVYERRWFEPGGVMPFEDITVPVPFGWREVLAASYPGGIEEPKEGEKRSNRDAGKALIDTRRSYKVYMMRFTGMLNGISGKRVLLFGAGDSLRIWLERYGYGLNVVCTFDNAPAKWGTQAYGVAVRNPAELPGMMGEDARLIIASIWHGAIAGQLEGMGIEDFYVFVDGVVYR